jgi:hypothetical protein
VWKKFIGYGVLSVLVLSGAGSWLDLRKPGPRARPGVLDQAPQIGRAVPSTITPTRYEHLMRQTPIEHRVDRYPMQIARNQVMRGCPR